MANFTTTIPMPQNIRWKAVQAKTTKSQFDTETILVPKQPTQTPSKQNPSGTTESNVIIGDDPWELLLDYCGLGRKAKNKQKNQEKINERNSYLNYFVQKVSSISNTISANIGTRGTLGIA